MALEHHYLRVDGTRVHYVTAGSGKPIVLIHGWGSSWLCFKDNIPELPKHFKIIALDLPGFGDSEWLDYHNLNNTVIFLEKFFDKLDINKPYLLGHSMGGIIALKYSIKHPEKVEKLILAGTPFYFPMWFNRILSFLFNLIRHDRLIWLGEKIKYNKLLLLEFFRILFYDFNKSARWHRELFEMEDKATVRGLLENGYDIVQVKFIDVLKDLQCPTLIIDGEKDLFTHQAKRFSRLIPNSKYVVIPQTKHCMLMEKSNEFNKIVLEFLK